MSWNLKSGTKEGPCHAWICMKFTSHEVELKEWKWDSWKYTSNPLSSKRIVLNSCCEWGHSSWLKSSSISSTTPHCSKSDTWSFPISSSSNLGSRLQFTSGFSWHSSLKIKGSPCLPSLSWMRDSSLRPHCWMCNSRLSSSCFNLSNFLRDMAFRIFVGRVLCFGGWHGRAGRHDAVLSCWRRLAGTGKWHGRA